MSIVSFGNIISLPIHFEQFQSYKGSALDLVSEFHTALILDHTHNLGIPDPFYVMLPDLEWN